VAIAYHLLAHKNPAQVERLFRVLYHPGDVFVLHFDRSAPRALHALGERLASAHSNVRVLRPRKILWGGSAMAEVQIAAMQAALKLGGAWTHFINLTGQDFPLKSRAEVLARLDPARSYLTWFNPVESGLWNNARTRLTRYHLHWPWLNALLAVPGLGRMLRALCGWINQLPYVPRCSRRWPDFFVYYGGSNHVALSRVTARYLVEAPDAVRIRRWLLPAGHSSEIVFQSVLLNSPLVDTLVNENWREIDFPMHAPNPRTFTTSDLPQLLACPALYGRKFDEQVDAQILDKLERHISAAA